MQYVHTCFTFHARLQTDLDEWMFKLPCEARLREKNNLMGHDLKASCKQATKVECWWDQLVVS